LKRGINLLVKFGAVAAMGVGIAFAASTGASAAPAPAVVAAPSITVTPTSGLADGATVQLSGTGLTPGTTYFIGECSAISATNYACDNATNFTQVANASGTIAAPVTVHSAFTGTTSSGATFAIDCKSVSCVVAAYSASFEGGAVPISFK
jgi:hypothetical protein